jgi:hypothetical protein
MIVSLHVVRKQRLFFHTIPLRVKRNPCLAHRGLGQRQYFQDIQVIL